MLDGPSSATVNYGRRAEISCTSHVARRDEINNVEDIDFFLALVIIAKSFDYDRQNTKRVAGLKIVCDS